MSNFIASCKTAKVDTTLINRYEDLFNHMEKVKILHFFVVQTDPRKGKSYKLRKFLITNVFDDYPKSFDLMTFYKAISTIWGGFVENY